MLTVSKSVVSVQVSHDFADNIMLQHLAAYTSERYWVVVLALNMSPFLNIDLNLNEYAEVTKFGF
ncbi:hypothetical protein DPMN_090445 [Dreissena polymorpha]|uniref:Uncharacterized protein n=1 Tax=Dreissena polymorpha TaxID=45954 RepID=A0A9D4L065_DREPO|nr:hypothetical protein DPMN_090445 [Dreissena polymorpha]